MTYTDKLMEEFYQDFCPSPMDNNAHTYKLIADFFLSKHNTLLDEIKEWARDNVMGDFARTNEGVGYMIEWNQGYNQALEDLLAFIETKR
jgi:hypothetical protein